MTARTNAAMDTQIANLLANNTGGDISEADVRSLLTDLIDTIYLPQEAIVTSGALTCGALTSTGATLTDAIPRLVINGTTSNAMRGVDFAVSGSNVGAVEMNAASGELKISAGPSAAWGGTIGLYQDTVKGLTLETNNDVTIETGDLVIGASGKGIDFSATSDATGSTSELLDDYEKGTFTPIITAAAGSGTITYTVQVGHYEKTSRGVFWRVYLVLSSLASRTGALTLGGLPYTTNSTSNSYSPLIVTWASGLAITAGQNLGGYINPNATSGPLFVWDGAGGPSALTHTTMTGGGAIIASGFYHV